MGRAESNIVTIEELAEITATCTVTITGWFEAGIIPAEIDEDKVLRFDAEKVLLILKHRAAKRAEDGLRRYHPSAYFTPAPPSHYLRASDDPRKESSGAFMEMIKAREAKEARKRGRK